MAAIADLQFPIVHNNGTSKDQLLDQCKAASCSLGDAYNALRNMAPNGRDYYPLGAEAMQRAQKQHQDRMKRLDDIKDEIDRIAVAIYDGF